MDFFETDIYVLYVCVSSYFVYHTSPREIVCNFATGYNELFFWEKKTPCLLNLHSMQFPSTRSTNFCTNIDHCATRSSKFLVTFALKSLSHLLSICFSASFIPCGNYILILFRQSLKTPNAVNKVFYDATILTYTPGKDRLKGSTKYVVSSYLVLR